MRTKYPLLVMVCVAVAGLMFQFSGVAGEFAGASPSDDLESMDKFNDSVSQHNPNEGLEGDASNAGDGDIIGLILSGAGDGFNILGIVMFLPNECTRLVPWMWWFCQPVGLAGQLVAFIGGVQWAIGRYLR